MNQRIYFLCKLFLVHFLFFAAFRVVFYFVFSGAADPSGVSTLYSAQDLRHAFYLGTKFDIRMAMILVAPVFVLGYLPFLNPIRGAQKFWRYFYNTLFVLWFMTYVSDFGYYAYLSSRINGTVFHFFQNIWISAEMVWQTYPVIPATLGLFSSLYLFNLILKKFVFFEYKYRNLKLFNQVASFVFFFLIFAGGIYGKLSSFPLRWSEAFFSQNSFISALSLNPVMYLIETYKYQKSDYNKDKVKEYYPVIANFLGVPPEEQNLETLNFARKISNPPRHPPTPQKPNVIFVMMESMASFKTSLMNPNLDSTPALKKLAQSGRYFPNFYIASEGTARSQFGTITGIPDVSTYKTASRNPLVVDQNVILDYFDGYRKFYFLGGNANWGQIRSVFTHNIRGVEVIEEGQFDSPVMDVWGISDLDLFKEAHKRLSQIKEPFVAMIQMASFHRPYTIPNNADDFKVDNSITEEQAVAAGFISVAEYNSLRFADYSIGRFLEMVQKAEYFDNTIFVFWGDHGLTDSGVPEHVPKIHRLAETSKFRVPLIFYGPKFFEPKEDTRVAWQMDIMTTVASFLGIPHTNTTFGRDLLDPRYDAQRLAFTFTYYYQPMQYSLIKDNFLYYVRGEKEFLLDLGTTQDLSAAASLNEVQDLKESMPELAQEMKTFAHGIFETARYMMYNNSKNKLNP